MEQKHILIADDEMQARFTLELLLEDAGYHISMTEDGLQALLKIEECQEKKQPIDLLILDIQMPNMTGLELIDKLEEKDIHIPILIISGQGDKKTIIELLSKGCLGYLEKPFDPQQLLKRISVALAKSSRIQKTQDKNDYYRHIVESMESAVYVLDSDNAIVFINDKMVQILGYTHEEIIGKSLFDFMNQEGQKHAKEHIENYKKNIKNKHTLKFINKNQGEIWATISVQPFIEMGKYTGAMAIAANVTQDKGEQDRKLNLLKTVIEQINEAIIIVDTNGNIQYINKAFEKFIDYTREEITNHHISFLQNMIPQETTDAVVKAVKEGETWGGQISVNKNGTIYEVNVTVSPTRNEVKNIANYVAVIRDVTSQTNLEKRFFQMQKLESLGTMAQGIAHDFNNICSIIKGHTQLLSFNINQAQLEDARESIEPIVSACDMAENLVQQIYAFSSPKEEQKSAITIAESIKESLNLIRLSLPPGIRLHQSLQIDTATIMADPTQISQILVNVCTNAIQAMPQKGFLEVSGTMVRLEETTTKDYPELKPGRYAMLTVTDTGCGMSEEIQERIFEPFFTTKEDEGTGIGLATVYKIVQQLKGAISVYSVTKKGTTFIVFLPLLENSKGTCLKYQNVHRACTILVADKEELVRTRIKYVFEQQGHTVIEAHNAENVIDFFQTYTFDLVLLDIDLEDSIDSLEICRFIRKDPYGILLPIIFIGDMEKKQKLLEGFREGANDFIFRSFTVPELLSQVNTQLLKSHQQYQAISRLGEHQFSIGDIITGEKDEYQINRQLASGGMGVIFYGTRVSDKEPVAIKVLKEEALYDHRDIQRFIREANALLKVRHENLVKGIELIRTSEHFSLVMEYVEGPSLCNLVLEVKKLSIKQILPIIIQIAEGLTCFHAQDFVHRDIKPGNIIVTPDSRTVLVDMGLTREKNPHRHITTKFILGSPLYMSPEQAIGKPVDQRSDIYSLGITFYYALTGEEPYANSSTVEIIMKKCSQIVPSLTSLPIHTPTEIVKIIKKMLQADMKKRYQNCEELLVELYEAQKKFC